MAKTKFSGVGESKVFVNPNADQAAHERLLRCHVGGELVSSLKPENIAALMYYMTDEAIEERAQAIIERNGGIPASGIKVRGGKAPKGADLNAQLAALRDTRSDEYIAADMRRRQRGESEAKERLQAELSGELSESSLEPWESTDPYMEAARGHIRPGMHPYFMDRADLNKSGNGGGGFEVVRGEDGKEIGIGNSLVLCQMPIEKAERRKQHFLNLDRQKTRSVHKGDPAAALQGQGGGLYPEVADSDPLSYSRP